MSPKLKHQTTGRVETNVSRPGVHSKCKTSNNKHSKHYKKKYRGQGR
jgi:hypothetical protein